VAISGEYSTWARGELAAPVAGTLLFALAAFVAVTSVASLLGYSEPKLTFLGIAILVAAAVAVLGLRTKRRLSGATGGAALQADAAQSALCALVGRPIAALAIIPLVVWEGREAMRGRARGCCWIRRSK
jgi:divalent metal cation (Fe/Co/Zn/Cd) transporter